MAQVTPDQHLVLLNMLRRMRNEAERCIRQYRTEKDRGGKTSYIKQFHDSALRAQQELLAMCVILDEELNLATGLLEDV